MKKGVFAALAAACLMIGSGASAQQQKAGNGMKERPTAEQMAQRQTERLTKELSLTEAQAKQVYDLNLAEIKAQEAQRQQEMAERKARAEKMKSILSDEQYAKWQQAQRAPRQGAPKEGRGGGKRVSAGTTAND